MQLLIEERGLKARSLKTMGSSLDYDVHVQMLTSLLYVNQRCIAHTTISVAFIKVLKICAVVYS